MTPQALRALIERGEDAHSASLTCTGIRWMTQANLYRLLTEAGVEGLRKADGKGELLRRLKNALTAAQRSRDRNEC